MSSPEAGQVPVTYHAWAAEALGFDWGSCRHLWYWAPHSICSINRRSSRPGFGGLLYEVKEWGPWVLGPEFHMPYWKFTVMEVIQVQTLPRYSSPPQPAGPDPSPQVALSLKATFSISYKIFLPMEKSRHLYPSSFACRGTLLNQLILNLSPVPWAGLFPK